MSDSDESLLNLSTFFDVDFYARAAERQFSTRAAAIKHYLLTGWKSGLNPSKYFDTKYYLNANADVAREGLNPLAHFLRYGESEGRRPRIGMGAIAAKPTAPAAGEWEGLVGRIPESVNQQRPTAIKVIIPVYKGYDDTLACIYSVLTARNETPYDLVVINDAGPDKGLNLELQRLAALGFYQLLENDVNKGFVFTVNRGLSEHPEADVILLNSDTIVYGDWIDRLVFHANSLGNVATITPFSNNATIFSYPYRDENNNQELEIDYAELDRIFATKNAKQNVSVPTGVGFCFYITRACLNVIGSFDEGLFGRGYGEENDLCMRAAEAGYVNLAALDVFVRHTGEVSFSDTAQAGKARAMVVLGAVHSRYIKRIQKYQQADPMAPARSAVDVARAHRVSHGRGVLHIEHGWGGGIERHIADLEGRAALEGVASFRLRLTPAQDQVAIRPSTGMPELPNLKPIELCEFEQLSKLIKTMGIGRVHIHSLVGYSYAQINLILKAIKMAGAKLFFTAHDYLSICPKINMIDTSGGYCASPSVEYCKLCLGREPSQFGQIEIERWRMEYGKVLAMSYKIFVPDSDVSERLRDYVDETTQFSVKPPPYRLDRRKTPAKPPRSGSGKSIAIIGAIGPHKGSRILEAMVSDVRTRRLDLTFTLFGYTDSDILATEPSVRVTGAYREDRFADLLRDNPCDLSIFLSVWPETFSYTLDLAFENNLYPVSFDIGAPARRIRELGFGALIPLSFMYDASLINDFLIQLPAPRDVVCPDEPDREWRGMAKYYG